jgi:hypothetical protein
MYATIVQTIPTRAATMKKTDNKPRSLNNSVKETVLDTRLFVSLPLNYIAKDMNAFAIYSSLCTRLGENSKLLKGVQSIKTGFALTPIS